MKKILLTGATGFVGKNILPILQKEFLVDYPTRKELNVFDEKSVDEYFSKNKADILVHCAICTPSNPNDDISQVLENVLKSFLNLKKGNFEKIIFIGSGAEFDKKYDIINASEDDLSKKVPSDDYGLSKYTLNEIARNSDNIYNARIFGCYGTFEPDCRFIHHAIQCCLENKPITIRQDCKFSYVLVDDLGRAIIEIIKNKPTRHDYNICNSETYLLSDLAKIVQKLMNADFGIQILDDKMNNEYTGSNKNFLKDFPDFEFTSIKEGIEKEIAWLKENR